MLVAFLVLVAVLLTIVAVVWSFISPTPVAMISATEPNTVAELDEAIARLHWERVTELRRRTTDIYIAPLVLLGVASLALIAALMLGDFSHPFIIDTMLLPAFWVVLIGRQSRRRQAQRQLDELLSRSI